MATINVNAGGSLQSAITNAQSGDVISVEAGASFSGPIELPSKTISADIVIQSSRVSELPQSRVNASHAGLTPKIICPHADQAIRTKPGAHHYKLDGIEVLPDSSATVIYDLVRFGGSRHDQQTLGSVPHHLKMDRCYIHGLPATSFQRGLTLNSSDSEVTRSRFSETHGRGMDAQAIASWNTPGRNKIVDCFLEAAGENVMFGGADPFSVEFIPSDCQILRSHFFKPLTWKGQGWVIKNLLEFKNGQRITVEGCLLENNWGGEGQSGIGVLFTVRNQEGSAPYSIVKDTAFINNIVKNCDGGALNFLGTDNEKPSQKALNAVIRNNVFDQIKGTFLTINGYDNVTIERNTHLQSGNTMMFYGGIVSQGFIYRDNITIEKPYGIRDETGSFEGAAAITKWTPRGVFSGNVIASPYTTNPPGNDYPASLTIGADYRHSYAGKGADVDVLMAAQSGVSSPTPIPPAPEPTPVPQPTEPGVKKVAWPRQEGKQTTVLNTQWADRYRLKDTNVSGDFAIFEKVN